MDGSSPQDKEGVSRKSEADTEQLREMNLLSLLGQTGNVRAASFALLRLRAWSQVKWM